MFAFAARCARKMAFFMAVAFERPCPMITIPLIPSRGAPPISKGSICLMTWRNAGFASRPPKLVSGLALILVCISLSSMSAVASIDLMKMLPVKPS